MIASGATRVASISPIRRSVILGHLSSGLGMLGCTETHVHRRIVRIQLRIMSTSDLHPSGSSQDGDCSRSIEMLGVPRRPTGDARVAARIARRIIMVV
jgi:hypothetical protein